MNLEGKVALVTGGAHRVGKGIARALAERGAHIVIHYGSSADAAEETRREITEEYGVQAMTHSADLAEPDAIAWLFAAVRDRFRRLDVLVNSAATFDHGPFDAITLEQWERSMNVNLRAPFLTTQHAARLFGTKREEAACIVNIADLSGLYPWRNFTQHGVSKAGLIHLTKITARELAPAVRVNALALGPIMPPQGASAESEAWQRTVKATPLGRSGSPQGVGQMVCAIAENAFMTGAILTLDSGESLLGPASN